MLGSMIVDVLSRSPELVVTATVREETLRQSARRLIPSIVWQRLDAAEVDSPTDLAVLDGHDWVVNCIGITKPLIRDDRRDEVERAVRINSLLPHMVAARAQALGARVIQIATDCVYSGREGSYREGDAHDPLDVYGKSKSLGEVRQAGVHHLRCSIVGPEPKEYKFLLEWFRRQPRGAQVSGYVNHRWNGVTTLGFAKLCLGVITSNLDLPCVQHVVPSGAASKAEMLQAFARAFHREDITVRPLNAEETVDRTLNTDAPELNRTLWRLGGYPAPPTVPDMIVELSTFPYRMAGLAAVGIA